MALDPANPAAAQGAAPVITALAESPPPMPAAEPPAGDEHQHQHGEAPVAQPPPAPAATEHQHGGSHEAAPATADEEKPAPPKKRAPAKDKGSAKPAATIYTCPMHPEVQSPKPGRCPKCGMRLVPKADKPGPEKEHQH